MTAKNDRGKRLLKRPAALEGLICLAAAALFVGIYGVQLLNPAYTDWLLTGGDSTQHYLGSAAFRQSRWFFPLGMMDTLHYPQTSSVIFTDSIPLLAVFFKAIRFLFPPQWQYMGLWGLSCLVLQAFLAARILREYTSSRWTVFAGSMLMTLSPVMIHRLYGHETLAAHWLLLCALQLLLRYRSRYHHPRNALRLAAFLGFVTPGIHMYFLPMCGFIVAGYALYDALMTRRVRTALAVLLVYGLAAALQIFLLGGYGQGDVTGGGFGLFGFDLNGFINSAGTSERAASAPAGGSAHSSAAPAWRNEAGWKAGPFPGADCRPQLPRFPLPLCAAERRNHLSASSSRTAAGSVVHLPGNGKADLALLLCAAAFRPPRYRRGGSIPAVRPAADPLPAASAV